MKCLFYIIFYFFILFYFILFFSNFFFFFFFLFFCCCFFVCFFLVSFLFFYLLFHTFPRPAIFIMHSFIKTVTSSCRCSINYICMYFYCITPSRRLRADYWYSNARSRHVCNFVSLKLCERAIFWSDELVSRLTFNQWVIYWVTNHC